MFRDRGHVMKRAITAFLATAFLVMLAGCSTKLTVDDGRKLDGQLVSEMRAYGAAAKALRPAIVRSAALNDEDCSAQYELPFDVMTSYGVEDEDAKVALVRALGVNETLRVIASAPSSGLNAGDIVTEVRGYGGRNTLKMIKLLTEARDDGTPFNLKLATGRHIRIVPFRICRGHVVVASPFQPTDQRYHWRQSVHPLEIFHQPLTADEAEWVVLWTQGLSERGGARMKTYAFMVGGLKWIATIGLGVTASAAAASTRGAATAAGASSGGQVAAMQLAGEAASMMTRSAANRASLKGVSRVAAGVFGRADEWAFINMRKLGMDPGAGLSLHQKLLAQGAAENAFLYDKKRLTDMKALLANAPQRARR
jgi:hypothetical protein